MGNQALLFGAIVVGFVIGAGTYAAVLGFFAMVGKLRRSRQPDTISHEPGPQERVNAGQQVNIREHLRAALYADPENAVLWDQHKAANRVEARQITCADNEDRANMALGEPSVTTRSFLVGDPGPAPFQDFDDFLARGMVTIYPQMREYPVLGCPELVIAMPVDDPDYERIRAEDLLAQLRKLPDIRLLRRLTVLDEEFKYQPWFRQTRPQWRLFGEVLADNEIVLYRPASGEDIAATLAHEWAHLLEFELPKWHRLFELVGDLEPFVCGATEPAIQERWATLGELLLRTDPALSPFSSYANPVRATIFTIALAERFSTVPADHRSTEYQFYEAVLAWDRESIRPAAVTRLQEIAASSDPALAVRAEFILSFLVDKPSQAPARPM